MFLNDEPKMTYMWFMWMGTHTSVVMGTRSHCSRVFVKKGVRLIIKY